MGIVVPLVNLIIAVVFLFLGVFLLGRDSAIVKLISLPLLVLGWVALADMAIGVGLPLALTGIVIGSLVVVLIWGVKVIFKTPNKGYGLLKAFALVVALAVVLSLLGMLDRFVPWLQDLSWFSDGAREVVLFLRAIPGWISGLVG